MEYKEMSSGTSRIMLVEKIRSCPKLFFVWFGVLCFSGIMLFTAFVAPYWVYETNIHYGLWRFCVELPPVCGSFPVGAYQTVLSQALTTLGFLGAGAAGLATIAFVLVEARRKAFAITGAVFCILSSIVNIVMLILSSIGLKSVAGFGYVAAGWAFYVFGIGSGFMVIAAILGLCVGCRSV